MMYRFFILFLLVFSLFTVRAQTQVDSLMRNKQVSDSLIRSLRGPGQSSISRPRAVEMSGVAIDSPAKQMLTPVFDSMNKNIAQPATIDSTFRKRAESIGGPVGDSIPKARWQGNPQMGNKPSGEGITKPTGAPAGMPTGMPSAMGSMGRMAIGHVYGKVVEAQGRKPVSYCSVSLYTMRDSLITGQLTEDNGDFSFTELPFGAYNLKVTFIGYKDVISKVMITPQKMEQDVGNISISASATAIKEVDVTAEKSSMELKVDRKVFNVGKDISARGGTGLDVMKNIPSVSVDASGNVTLRNNTPQVYIDGKPTTLTLEQIPADQIDRVEVITNPSAKFEAASSGGILNVVMKRNTKPGYNGLVNLNIATNTGYNGMAMFNLKEKKFGVNLMYTINGATNRTNGYFNTTAYDSLGQALGYANQNINSNFKRIFQVARVGFDFYINNRNTLSISENAVFGNFNTIEDIAINNDSFGINTSNGQRVNTQLNHFRNFTTDISFKHTYPKEGKEYALDVQYNHSQGGGDYLYKTDSYYPDGNIVPSYPLYQILNGGQHADMITLIGDFSLPVGKNMKIETGFRSNYKLTYSYSNVNDETSINGVVSSPQFNTALSNNYRIDDLVNGAYITFSHQIKGFSYQLGLRAEQVYYKGTTQVNGGESFAYQYPTDAGSIPKMLFPSLNISQKIGARHEFQLNVARKSNRPNFFQIAPFIFSSVGTNYQRGNPALQPEFINQGEINYNFMGNKVSWLSSVYARYVQQPITNYLIDSGTFTISTYNNADYSASGGWENTLKLFPVKKLDITLSGNVFYTDIIGGTGENNVSNKGWSWLAKATVSYKLPLDFTVQANGTYEAPKILPQGKTTPMYFFDLSLSKDFGFFTLNFTVSDVLNSRASGSHLIESSSNSNIVSVIDQSRRRDQRFAKLGVSFRFGKMDASLFKKKRPGQDQNGGGDMGF